MQHKTRIIRESDYSPTAAFSCRKKANVQDMEQNHNHDINQGP